MKFASFYFIDYFIVFFYYYYSIYYFENTFEIGTSPVYNSRAKTLLQLYQKEIVCNELKLFEINISYILYANPV